MKNIITISREYGTGGMDLGIRLAKELDYKFYNKDLLTDLAEQLMVPESFIEQYDKGVKRNIFNELFPHWSSDAIENERYIFEEQGKFICRLADEGNCVFAGRRADYYLRDYPNALHIFLYAPLEDRIAQVAAKENLTARKAEKKIDEIDKMRKSSYECTTGRKWAERLNYSLMINTTYLSEDQIVKIVCDYINLSE